MTSITTLLVANRGEIAVRIMRTAKAMGLRTIAVYSDADANAMHVRVADAAVHIGGSAVGDSYLCADKILDAARRMGADAVHPGYGFLSENAAFSEACADAGIVFVGPPNGAIDVMGDKARAKRAMLAAGVPCVPGYQGDDQTLATLTREAEAIGMPVMVKAAAGGGGRGMRLVHHSNDLASAIGLAKSEAQNAFGSSDLIIEKAIQRPRHVEVQVFADTHGNVVHLGERDCSIQRRHQKVVEEAPCPIMTPELRSAMGHAAVEAARAVDYVGAGTVEFLLDASGHFYFLEMNTRLQVEHPVTEAVTGFDLVEWQLRVARGEPLPAEQDDIELLGHAIEVRLYAEDPVAGFLPSTGPVELFYVPDLPGIRVDSGVASGDAVSPFYDAMVAKIIAYGETREDARLRLSQALRGSALLGLSNNRDFLIDVLGQQVFADGEATTAFIEDHYGDFIAATPPTTQILAAAAVIQHALDQAQADGMALSVSDELLDWSSSGDLTFTRQYDVGDQHHTIRLNARGPGDYRVAVDDVSHDVYIDDITDTIATLCIDERHEQYIYDSSDSETIRLADGVQTLTLTDLCRVPPESAEEASGGAVKAPMHGLLLAIEVKEGDAVVKGQRVGVLEAMKMQHEILAGVDGTVEQLAATPGAQIGAGDLILMIVEG